MGQRVGICAVAQSRYVRSNTTQRFQGMAWEIVASLLEQTGLRFGDDGIDTAISVSDDVYDARTISNNALSDVLGAHYQCEEKVAQDGAQAVYYAAATVLSGHTDVVIVVGHCKESQGQSRNIVTHLSFDPFFTRPVGLDGLAAAALQAQAYARRSDVGPQQLARVVVHARAQAAHNPHTADIAPVTEDEVLASRMLADPIRELHCHPVSDGAVGLIIASEERARQICERPVWITGLGNCMDSFYLGERQLGASHALAQAAHRAYQRAGVCDPAAELDLVELSDPYAHQLPLWLEQLELCPVGRAGAFIDDGGLERRHVNPSGGTLGGNPLILGGLVRAAEAATQLMGRAGRRQVDARRALAHGVMGPAGQLHSVIVLERD